jgi:GrpB-like predicted nucleotidyltransferase (UPF0157 family)
VEGLLAKPTVDILVGIYRLLDASRAIPRMERLGYVYIASYEDQLPERRFFRYPADRSRFAKFNVHMVEVATPFFERHVAFRDWMRAHPEDRVAYANLKRDAAARFPDDRLAYTEAKTPFIRAVEEKALAAGHAVDERANRKRPA